MRKIFGSTLLGLSLLSMVGCQSRPVPFMNSQAGLNQVRALSQSRAAGDLVEAPGFKSGDSLKVKGPLWFKGKGKLHLVSPDAFDLEFSISSYHIRVSATRIDAKTVKVVTRDLKAGTTEEAIAQYSRSGNTSVFNIGKGQKVEKLTVRNQRNGYFEAVVVQPGLVQNDPMVKETRGNTTLKFSRG